MGNLESIKSVAMPDPGGTDGFERLEGFTNTKWGKFNEDQLQLSSDLQGVLELGQLRRFLVIVLNFFSPQLGTYIVAKFVKRYLEEIKQGLPPVFKSIPPLLLEPGDPMTEQVRQQEARMDTVRKTLFLSQLKPGQEYLCNGERFVYTD